MWQQHSQVLAKGGMTKDQRQPGEGKSRPKMALRGAGSDCQRPAGDGSTRGKTLECGRFSEGVEETDQDAYPTMLARQGASDPKAI